VIGDVNTTKPADRYEK